MFVNYKMPKKKEMLLECLINSDLKKLKKVQVKPRLLISQFPESLGVYSFRGQERRQLHFQNQNRR